MTIDLSIFPSTPFPSHYSLVESRHLGDNWEYDAINHYLTGKTIAQVNLNSLTEELEIDWTSVHHLLTNQAFAFFLPSFMKVSQDNFNNPSDYSARLADSLCLTLRRMAEGDLSSRLVYLLENYTQPQLSAIAKYLKELSELHYADDGELNDAQPALDKFWGQYLQSTE